MDRTAIGVVEQTLDELASSDDRLAEILRYIEDTFPTYDQALGAMGQRDTEPPQAADTSRVRLKIEPATTAEVK